MKVTIKRNDFIFIFFIVLVSLYALQTFFQPGLFETHDGRLHTIKLYWYVEALKSGQFPVRWTETANHRYGYPIFNFYYPLLFLLGSIPNLLGVSLVDSFKIILASTYLLSGVLFYLFLREWFRKIPALVGTLLYQFAPYRFVSLFVTGRWAESISFAFIPLFFLTTSKFSKTGKRQWLGASGCSLGLLILSHNIQSFLFFPIILIWLAALFFFSFSHMRLRHILFIVTSGLFMSAFFWAPALYELKWTYQGQHPAYDFRENFPSLRSYIYFPWGYGFSLTGTPNGVSPMIGIAQLATLGAGTLCIVAIVWKFEEKKKFLFPLFSLLLISGIAFFFMNRISAPLWERIPLLPSIQYPSRITAILIFVSAVIAAIIGEILFHRHASSGILYAAILTFIAVYGNRNYLRAAVPDRFNDHDVVGLYQSIFGTGETAGENSPIWSQSLPPEYDDKITVVYDRLFCPNIGIIDSRIEPRRYLFTIVNESGGSQKLQANTIYYPGWKILIDKKEAPVLNLSITSKNKFGLIQFRVPPGRHDIEILMKETPFRHAADLVSLLSSILLISSLIPHKDREQ